VFSRAAIQVERAQDVRLVHTKDPRGHEELLVQIHAELSLKGRTSVRAEIAKLTESFKRGRMSVRQLPGRVEVWPLAETLLFVSEIGRQRLKSHWHIGSQIPDLSEFDPKRSGAVFV